MKCTSNVNDKRKFWSLAKKLKANNNGKFWQQFHDYVNAWQWTL